MMNNLQNKKGKPVFAKIGITMFALFLCIMSFAATKTSVANGNWSSAATWSPSGVPTSTDDVIINTNVTLDVNIDLDPGVALLLIVEDR